jgi:hypothetical protein
VFAVSGAAATKVVTNVALHGNRASKRMNARLLQRERMESDARDKAFKVSRH